MAGEGAGTEGVLLGGGGPEIAVAPEDELLVAGARQGDAAAFDQLYRRHRDQVYTLCLNLCGDTEEAADLLQEAFVQAWRGLPRFAGRSKFTTWLYRIAVNACRDAARRRRRLPKLLPPSPDPDAAIVDRVRAALTTLRPSHRVALVLRYSLSLSYQEMADLLNWSLPRVRGTLHRARRAFKHAYVETDEDQP
jgi:RNA polymerase sigma-70 factor (ECF subfamily)